MSADKNSNKRLMLRRRLRVERLADRRVLAAITGVVFEDLDLSFRQDPGENGLGDRIVYIDSSGNGLLDSGEELAVTDDAGVFVFDELGSGSYPLRLYNGTDSQEQVIPVGATPSGEDIAVSGGVGLAYMGESPVAITNETVEFGNFETGEADSIQVGSNIFGSQTLPDGSLILVGQSDSGDKSWIVNAADRSVSPIQISENSNAQWSSIAVDGNGHGLLIDAGATPDPSVYTIDASDQGSGILFAATDVVVPVDAQAIASETGARSVLAWSGSSGLELSLWSNSTGTWITSTPTNVPDATELVAYDDASGLLVLRTSVGGLAVHDVDNNFATLSSIDEPLGAVVLDGERDLLVAIAADNASIHLFDATDGEEIAAIDAAFGIGTVLELDYDGQERILTALGATGISQLVFDTPESALVTITNDEDPPSPSFGIAIVDENTAPSVFEPPAFLVEEDFTLFRIAPGALAGATDAETDDFIALISESPANGTIDLRVDGSLTYTPDGDFSGTDSFKFAVHDGRDRTDDVIAQIVVTPTPDPPTDIEVNPEPLPENAEPGIVLGPVIIRDVDGQADHQILVNDGRFEVIGGQLIFVGGQIDFEDEPFVELVLEVEDLAFGTTISETVRIRIIDANDPITEITPQTASVYENSPGALIATMTVNDQDANSNPTLTTDDSRFVFDGLDLRLAEGVSLDYEEASQVVINVTATDGDSLTQEVTITVFDEPEQATSIELSHKEVVELLPGAAVGEVEIDGNVVRDSYVVSVSDPRFEIVGSTLKLVEDQWVERSNQEQIQLTITAQDVSETFNPLSQQFVIEVIENTSPFHNADSPFDVDRNGVISAADALAIINYLNTFGPGPVGPGDPGYGYDVNSDRMVTVLDALLVMNELNRIGAGGGGTVGGEEPEGEKSGDSTQRLAEDDGEDPVQPDVDPGNTIGPVQMKVSQFASTPPNPTGGEAEPADEDDSAQERQAKAVDSFLKTLSDESE